jgi:hypothetical protein
VDVPSVITLNELCCQFCSFTVNIKMRRTVDFNKCKVEYKIVCFWKEIGNGSYTIEKSVDFEFEFPYLKLL